MHFLSAHEVELLVNETPPPYDLLIYVLAYGGLRWGGSRCPQALPLRSRPLSAARSGVSGRCQRPAAVWPHEDLCRPQCGDSSLLGRRAPRHLQDEVRPDATALVFTGRGDQPLRNSSFHKAVWAPAVRRAGLPVALRIHDLRHTCAALLIDQGAHVKAIQRHLGHSSPVVTLNTYTHLFPEELDRLGNRLDETRARGLAAPPPGPNSNVVKLDEREVQRRAVTRNSLGRRAWDSNP